jgi:hypothetical protein
MEIAYLGRPLSAQQRKAAEAFYEKLSPAQQREYSQKSRAEYELMWGNEPPHPAVMGQIKWVLRAQQMERDYAGQIYRGAEQTQQPKQTKKDKPAAISTEKGVAQSPKEPNGIFDASFAKDYYQTLYNQGKQENNLFKMAGGSLGGGIATNYLDLAGLAQRGVEASANLVVSGQQEGGLGGLAKQGVGYTTGLFGSLATQENLPSTLMTVGTMNLGTAANAGKLGIASKPILRTMQVGGAFLSGTSIGQGISGKNMFTGEQLSPFERGFNLTFGVAGSALDMYGAGFNPKNLSGSFPMLTSTLKGVSAPKATPLSRQAGRLSNESGSIRLGSDPDEMPKGAGKAEPEIVKPKEAGPQGEDTVNNAAQKDTTIGKQKKADHVKDEAGLPKGSTPAWKASMSEAEADVYTKNSYYEGKTFYHGTNEKSASSISEKGINPNMFDELSTYGPGFYVGNDRKIASDYAKRKAGETGETGAVVGVRLKVNKPKVFRTGNEYQEAVTKYVKQAGKTSEEWAVVYTDYLKSQGYDAVEISGIGYTTVFKKEQMVVTSNEVVRD